MATRSDVAIHWFRQDLRLSDNPALTAASNKANILPIYILDDTVNHDESMGAASKWWLHHSLAKLDASLDGSLNIYKGDPKQILLDLVSQYSVSGLFWNRCYEPSHIDRDKELKQLFIDRGLEVKSFNGSLLWEPWEVQKADGSPYRVFTPFFRRGCLSKTSPRSPLPVPKPLQSVRDTGNNLHLDELNLLPRLDWADGFKEIWKAGEQEALKKMDAFIHRKADDYKSGRNYPAKEAVSRLSPHLHFGEVSPNTVWHALKKLPDNDDVDCVRTQLGWREFSYSLLYYFPSVTHENLQSKFNRFPWRENQEHLRAWQQGKTGYPLVDAGMRELWQTGYMHNRVRMVVGSFLVKNLLIHWRRGQEWFWDCLVDADLANNSLSWQWIAGCGVDAAPFFRIFNPVTQSEKYDPDGDYTRRFVPELKDLPNKYLHQPWIAPEQILEQADITLGDNYPLPIVDIKYSRERALEAYRSIKQN